MGSFCHGASKVGAISSIKYHHVLIHHVPILYCPVCQSVEPHPRIRENLDLIVSISRNEGLEEVDFNNYITFLNYDVLFENVSTVNKGNWEKVVQQQIDISLDLLSVARLLQDQEWEEELKLRLSHLSKQKDVTTNR